MRKSEIKRMTNETEITLSLDIDGTGENDINTGCGFLDHMLTLFAVHGRFDLAVTCYGDTEVDYHHSAEDIGICLGDAFAEALGDKKGITRYGSMMLPMDEALALVAVDISGRPHLSFDAEFPTEKVGDFDTELVEEFLLALTRRMGLTLHVKMLAGKNTHHMIEAIYKSLARSLRAAVKIDPELGDAVPSSKGVL